MLKSHRLADNILQYHEHLHQKLKRQPVSLSYAQVFAVHYAGPHIGQDLYRKSTLQPEQQAEA